MYILESIHDTEFGGYTNSEVSRRLMEIQERCKNYLIDSKIDLSRMVYDDIHKVVMCVVPKVSLGSEISNCNDSLIQFGYFSVVDLNFGKWTNTLLTISRPKVQGRLIKNYDFSKKLDFKVFSTFLEKGSTISTFCFLSSVSNQVSLHLPEKDFSEKHFPERTFGRMDISPKTYFPEWILARMYIRPSGRFPENLFSRIKLHFLENHFWENMFWEK